MAMKFLQLLFFFSFQLRLSFSGQTIMMESVPDLQSSMYMTLDGYPCVRLLNLSGVIGCSNPGRVKVVAPIIRLNNATELSQLSAVLLSVDEIQSFLTRILNDSTFAKNVAGILVESSPEFQSKLKGFSPDQKFPQSEFAPYQSINYEWNPIVSSFMYLFLFVSVCMYIYMLLTSAAIKNEKNVKSYTADVAEFDLVMQTTKAGTHDSESCLKENTCLPLGGYSVWSSLPPINFSSSEQSKPIILVVASMDSASFFRDKGLGADSPISGLISLLAAVDALSHVDGLDDFNKQLVFIVFTGEAWGYLGSRRFLLELDLQSDAVSGLNYSLIEKVVEIGSVGKGLNQGVKNFFVHTTGVSSATNETLDALKRAQDSVKSESFTISSANASNPGIPPSSLMTFLRKVCNSTVEILTFVSYFLIYVSVILFLLM
ncbi:PREDICTED: nicastrin-like [Prunus mume]|uniref:Nicastrin n=1 Tax=Prunus mume TaxID=102107 RepID=A0ABM1LY01_PRUMU|nr:PREDICTED: nicastrin-like [Prunus mume]